MPPIPRLSRRSFIKAAASLSAGLVIPFVVLERRAKSVAAGSTQSLRPNAFLNIATDDSITVFAAHAEMGQGIWTTLSMLVAEELDIDYMQIRIQQAPSTPEFGKQVTSGSGSTMSEFERYRQVGAVARHLLLQAAAQNLGVTPDALRTDHGAVLSGNHRLTYGSLVETARTLRVPDMKHIPLKKPEHWKVIGRGASRIESPEKIDGSAKFSIDVQFDGLLTAVVDHSPVIGGTVKSYDASRALSVPGVRKVVQVPSGVAIVADHYWAALVGRDALHIVWQSGPGQIMSDSVLRKDFAMLATTPGSVAAKGGFLDSGLGESARSLEMEYSVPYLAHAPMEPLNRTVSIKADSCDIWVGTQAPNRCQDAAAKITGLSSEQIRVHSQLLGGAFGRRAVQDYVSEAVYVAKATGQAVKTIWTREDDTRGGNYRAAYVQRIKVGLDTAGDPITWHHVIAGQAIHPFPFMIDSSSVEGVVDSPYITNCPSHRVELHSPKTVLPVWYWRSVGHSFNGFVMEGVIDELAHAAGQDPVEYRRRLLKNEPQYLSALELAAERFGWGQPPPPGRGHGFAIHKAFGTVVAEAVEVSITNGALRVHRVVCAVNCGVAVNPRNVEAQMQSAIVFGLTAALYGRLTIIDGRVQQSNFHDYKVLRMDETPHIDVHIVPSTEAPGGVGEAGTPPIAPAVANAIFSLTGERLRDLPLCPTQATVAGNMPAARSNLSAAVVLVFMLLMSSLCGCSRGEIAMSSAVSAMPNDVLVRNAGDHARADSRILRAASQNAPSTEEAVAAFSTINAVLQHPRCSNCHIPGDRPLQFDNQVPHAMHVVRGEDGHGAPVLRCSTCHGEANLPTSYGDHAPPGAPKCLFLQRI